MTNNAVKNKNKIKYGLAVLVAAAVILAVIVLISPGKDDPSKYAGELYEHRIEDINDTALIAELFEVMELADVTGEYTVEISQEGDTLVLAVNALEAVQNADKKVFDDEMKVRAQQMLALIPQVGRVQWTYPVETAGSKEEASVGSLSRVEFASDFGKAPEYFGKSEEHLQKLLEQQNAS